LLKSEDIKGGALYAEYRTDDARLTIEIAKRAAREGAVLVNYVKATEFLYQQDQVRGVEAVDSITNSAIKISAAAVVNATGPWVDDLRSKNNSLTGKKLHLTKGVHIVVPYHRLPVRQAIYFDVPDGRMIFAIPRRRVTYVGTTDTDYRGDKEEVRATVGDVRYLLNAVNEAFPSVHLNIADVESSWAGLRPLIHEEGKSASELSRKDEIFESDSGLISIAGGKLTGYRKMAERVLDLLVEKVFSEKELDPCTTDQLMLAGSGFATLEELARYVQSVADRVESLGLKGITGAYLVHLYGRQADEILKVAESANGKDNAELNLTLAEMRFALDYEQVVHADDFLVRRTGMLFFDVHRLGRVKDEVVAAMAVALGWDAARQAAERDRVEEMIAKATNFTIDDKG